MTDVTRSDLLI